MPDLMYVHGYDERERERLLAQARAVEELLFAGVAYPPGARVLEMGCGTGAQTVVLAQRSPGARIVSVDRSAESLRAAESRVRAAGLANVEFHQADLFALPFPDGAFDHVFVCFVLEHLADPLGALRVLRTKLGAHGTITVFEGDHGSTLFHPDDAAAHRAIDALVTLQRAAGGNALIGRELYPLLRAGGFREVRAEPRMVYVDASVPQLVDGFIERTFTAMIDGVRDAAVAVGVIDEAAFDDGIRALRRTKEEDGVFCYTFFKAVGRA